MNFLINQKELEKKLTIASKGISTNNIYPILTGVLLEAKNDNTLKIRSTDMEIGIEVNVAADVKKEGKIVIPGKIFMEIIRKLPNIELEFNIPKEGQIKIKYGVSSVYLNYFNSNDFPEAMDFKDKISFNVSGINLKKAINISQICVSTDGARPIFTGILIEKEEDKLNFVSSDTHRIAKASIENNDTIEDFQLVIPAKSLREIANIIEEDEEVTVDIASNKVMFNLRKGKVFSRLIEGQFVNYKQVIPSEFSTNIKILKNSFLSSLERAFLLSRDDLKSKLNTVKIKIGDSKLAIDCVSSDLGNIHEEIPVFLDGEEIELGFNAKYLIEMIKNIDSEELDFKLIGSQKPGIITPVASDREVDILFLVLPIRIAN